MSRAPGAGLLIAGLALAAACGGGDKATFAGAGGATASGGASASGGAGTGGVPGAGGASAGGAGSGAGGRACVGTRTSSGACFIPCSYAPGFPPRYESGPGPCTSVGWKCTPLQHCNANTPCTTDAACDALNGPGFRCVRSTDAQLDGQCAIACETDSDCPVSTAPSPYACKEIGDGQGPTVKVCQF